jgi:hypothetical protein
MSQILGETEEIVRTLQGLLPTKEDEVKSFAEDLGYETLPLANQKNYTLYNGKEMPGAPGGYKGRMGLYTKCLK